MKDAKMSSVRFSPDTKGHDEEARQRRVAATFGTPGENKGPSVRFAVETKLVNQENNGTMHNQTSNKLRLPKPKGREMTLGDFGVGRQLGKGKFGFVHLAKEKSSGKKVALKIMWKADLEGEGYADQVKREIEIHSRMRCDYVVRLFTYFSDALRIYLVLEYIPNGNVLTEMHKHPAGRLPEPRAAYIMHELVTAISLCHKIGVVHRDIKPENILIAADGSIRLADFGWSVSNSNAHEKMKRLTLCGTLDYIPPEMTRQEQYDERVDIWMAGCVAAEMLVGSAPFYNEDWKTTEANIQEAEWQLPPDCSQEAQSFVSQFLVKDPAGRLFPIRLALFHPWFRRLRRRRQGSEEQDQ